MLRKLLLLSILFIVTAINAQVNIQGVVYDEYLEPFPSATVKYQGKYETTDFDGNFSLKLTGSLPVTIEILAVGYTAEIVEVTDLEQEINVILKETSVLEEVVVSASRTPEKVLESPVTIERLGIRDIKRTASATFYDAIENLKGIESKEVAYGYKSFNARGFSTFDSTRFVQLVDGVETTIPAASFSAGNVFGLSDLDVQNVEVLPGAASALYGPNAFNGILLMKSKSPFDFEGISTYVKGGVTSQEAAGNNEFYDVGIRMAHKFNDNFAAKVNFTYFDIEAWHANDRRNTTGIGGVIKEGTRKTDLGYDGVNVYGDEISVSLRSIAQSIGLTAPVIGLLPEGEVSRTGYLETDLVDNRVNNLKFDGSLHFRPFENKEFEVVLSSRLSKGVTPFQGTNRVQQNYFFDQYKLEFLGDNFFVRGYYSGANSDENYDLRYAGIGLVQASKSNEDWYRDYITFYLKKVINPNTGLPFQEINLNEVNYDARKFAERDRLIPGTTAFKTTLNELKNIPLNEGGTQMPDASSLYHIDGNYNFKDLIDFAEIQIGGSYRSFNINSSGTIFTDRPGDPIIYDVYGAYAQVQKKMFNDRLKFTGSVRYDEGKNLDGNFSPRLALNYFAGDNKNHIFRIAAQRAFRNPSTLEQFLAISLAPGFYSLGTAQENLDRFVSSNGITGKDIFDRGLDFFEDGSFAPTKLEKVTNEKVRSYEVGYRGLVNLSNNNIIDIDINAYYNLYEDFSAFKNVVVPNQGGVNPDGTPDNVALQALANDDYTVFQLNTNSVADVNSYGGAIGLNTKIFKRFDVGANYTFNKLIFNKEDDPTFQTQFNTPEHQVKLMFGNPNVFKNLGFNINYRWQSEYLWESSFLVGNIEQRSVIDAQINYSIPSMKSRFKIGGTNLTGNEYSIAPGSGNIGSLYYISWTIND